MKNIFELFLKIQIHTNHKQRIIIHFYTLRDLMLSNNVFKHTKHPNKNWYSSINTITGTMKMTRVIDAEIIVLLLAADIQIRQVH